MEKVQFQLESTLPELKDLEEKGLFSKVSFSQSAWPLCGRFLYSSLHDTARPSSNKSPSVEHGLRPL
jgi:hypothetical protein